MRGFAESGIHVQISNLILSFLVIQTSNLIPTFVFLVLCRIYGSTSGREMPPRGGGGKGGGVGRET